MKKSLVKNAIYKLTLNFFNLILPIIIGPYVYRTLGSGSIGSVKFAESIFNYFFIFASFGIYQYGLREVSRVKNDKEKVSKLFTSLFTFGLLTNIISLIFFLIISYVGYSKSQIFPILLLYSFNFLFNIFFVEWVVEAFENFDFITIKTIIVKIIYVILLLTFVKNSNDYLTFVALLIISNVLNNIISFIYIKRQVAFNFKAISIVPHLKPLFLVVIFSNGNMLYTQLDRFMLGEFVNKASVSYYVMAHQIMTIINAVIISIIQVTVPRLSYLAGNNNDESYLFLLNKIVKIYFFILFPASIGLLTISDIGVVVYGGADFAKAGAVLAVFSIFMITIGVESILSNQVIYVKKRERVLVIFIFICGFINLLFKGLLVYARHLSAESAIFTTTTSNCILIALEYLYIRKRLNIKFNPFTVTNFKYLFLSLLFIPISILLRGIITNIYVEFVTIIITCSLVYFGLLLLAKDDVLFLIIEKATEKIFKKKVSVR
jgi:O-antigen/teichoic acid export membrane protein